MVARGDLAQALGDAVQEHADVAGAGEELTHRDALVAHPRLELGLGLGGVRRGGRGATGSSVPRPVPSPTMRSRSRRRNQGSPSGRLKWGR